MRKEKEPKAPKIKKIKQRKRISFNSIFFLLVSLVLTICLFIGLVILENRLSGKVIYTSVVVAKNNMDSDVVITEENVNKFFHKQNIVQSDAVDGVLYDVSALIGLKSRVPLVKDEPALLKDFENLSSKTSHIQNPVQVAIDTGSLSTIAGGILREGDTVNIAITTEIKTSSSVRGEYVSTYVMEGAYISAAMSSSGSKIDGNDKDTPATMLLLIIEKDDELTLSDALANGKIIRVSKVLY